MTTPKQYGSSFENIGGSEGVKKSSLEKWRSTISPMAAGIMDVAHRPAIKLFGYDRDEYR